MAEKQQGHRLENAPCRERFVEERFVNPQRFAFHEELIRVAGHVQHFHVGLFAAKLLDKLRSAQARHRCVDSTGMDKDTRYELGLAWPAAKKKNEKKEDEAPAKAEPVIAPA